MFSIAVETRMAESENGWMNKDIFLSFIWHLFLFPILKEVAFPILLYVDRHLSHVTLEVAELCQRLNIFLIVTN